MAEWEAQRGNERKTSLNIYISQDSLDDVRMCMYKMQFVGITYTTLPPKLMVFGAAALY